LPAVETGEPVSVRGALRSLLTRVAVGGDPSPTPPRDPDDADGMEEAAPAIATRFENKVRTLRANAHAAYHSVEGTQHTAVDAALDVIEAEWHAARIQRDRYAEALKSIRLYAGDMWSRAMAHRALGLRCDAAGERPLPIATGMVRYPFMDEFDA
jgi:hypothetical protein